MKNFLITILTLLFLISCKKERNIYSLIANVKDIEDSTKVFLIDYRNNIFLDSTYVIKHKFAFKGSLEEPIPAGISIYNNEVSFFLNFWLDKGQQYLNTSKKEIKEAKENISLRGGKTNEIAKKYAIELDPLTNTFSKLKRSDLNNDEYQKYKDSVDQQSYSFFMNNPNNYFSVSQVLRFKNTFTKEQSKKYFELLNDKFKKSTDGLLLNNFLYGKKLMIGDPFIEIEGYNLKKEKVRLSDFKGKTILLNFWAAWCKPCIKEIIEVFPEIQKAYGNENFVIVNFSFDHDMSSWKSMSEKLKIDWPNFSNLKGFSDHTNTVMLDYGIKELPTNFIINDKGKILKRLEYEDNLVKELEDVFSQKKRIKL